MGAINNRGGRSSGSYINPDPTTETVGGIDAGSTFPDPGLTYNEMFTKLLYPYHPPTFTAFAIQGQIVPVEVGYTIPASTTFTWATSQSTNVVANSISIKDQTLNVTFATSLANDGSELANMGAPVQEVSATSHTFRIIGQDTELNSFQRDYVVTWRWRLFYGVQAAAVLNGAQVVALAGSKLTTGYSGAYLCGAAGYKYVCFAHVAGGQINSVVDASTGFAIPMASVSDNAAYSNIDGGGFSYALVSVTNVQGVTTNYRVYRTRFSIGGAVTLTVS